MRKIHILGLMIFAALTYGVVGASSAFAADEWLVDGAALTGTQTVHVEALLGGVELEDMGTGVSVLAEGTFLGVVAAGGADLVEAVTVESAVFVKPGPCVGGLVVQAVDLPWSTQLELEGTMLWDNILQDGSGAPGWLVECKLAIGTAHDICTSETGRTLVENAAEGEVSAEFDNGRVAKCEGVLGAGEGLITSDTPALLFALEGLTLTVN